MTAEEKATNASAEPSPVDESKVETPMARVESEEANDNVE
jgi:hypothetical protein